MFKVPSVVHIGQADPNFADKLERNWSGANDDSTFCHFANMHGPTSLNLSHLRCQPNEASGLHGRCRLKGPRV